MEDKDKIAISSSDLIALSKEFSDRDVRNAQLQMRCEMKEEASRGDRHAVRFIKPSVSI